MFEEFKKLFKHSVIYGLGSIITRIMGFLMIPVYTHYLTTKEYGIIEILDLVSYIISTVIIAGFVPAASKYYFSYKKEDDKNHVISSALIFTTLMSLIGSIILIIFSKQCSFLLFKTDSYAYYCQLSFVALFFEIFLNIPFLYLRLKDASVLYIIISIVRVFLGLILNIYFIVFLHLKILGVLYSAIIVGMVSSIYLIFYTIRCVGISFSYSKTKEMLRFGLPLIPADMGMYLLNYFDRFFLNYLCSLSMVGIYAIGYKFGMILSTLIGTPFTMIWVAFRFEIAERNDAKEIYARVLTYFEFIVIFFTLWLMVLIKDIMSIVVSKEFFDAYKIIPLIAISYFFFGANSILRMGIYLEKKTKWMFVTVWIPLIFTIILGSIIIPRYSIMGAGIIKIFSFFFMAWITYFISQKFYPIQYEFKRILKMIGTALLLYGINSFIYPLPLFFSLILRSLIVCMFPVLLYYFNFYDEKEKGKVKEIYLKYMEKYCQWVKK